MDEELKQKIRKIAETTLRELEVDGLKVTLEGMVRKTQLPGAENARISAAADMRRRLSNARLWKSSSEAMCEEWMGWLFLEILRKQEASTSKAAISAARERQMELFPGFENLPVRVRAGNHFIQFAELPVPQFLEYEAKYQARAQRNHQMAEELHRIAVAVAPVAESDPTVDLAAAYRRAQAGEAKIAVMPRLAK